MCHFFVEVLRMWADPAMLSHTTAMSQIKSAPFSLGPGVRMTAESELIHMNMQCGQQISLCCKPLNPGVCNGSNSQLELIDKTGKNNIILNISFQHAY